MRYITLLLLPVWLLCHGCDNISDAAQSIKETAVSKAKITLYEQRIRSDIKAWQQELALLRQVTDVESLKQAEAKIKTAKQQRAKQSSPPRLTFQEEQNVDKSLMTEFKAVIDNVIKEKSRIAQIEGVAEYRRNQNKNSLENKAVSLFQRLTPDKLTDKDKITSDPSNYLKNIHQLMDAWRGTPRELAVVKNRLDQFLSVNSKDSQGYSTLARYYLNEAVFDRSKNLVNALTVATYAEKLNKENSDAAIIKCAVQLQWRDWRSAEKEIAKAKALASDSFWFHIHSAQLAKVKEKPQEAESILQALLKKELSDAQRARALTDLSNLKMAAGEFAESLKLHQQSVKIFPDFHWRHGNYGFALLHQAGNLKQAEIEAHTALKIRSYGSLKRLLADIQMTKWAINQTSSKPQYNDPDTLTFKPSKKQLEAMLVRVGNFKHKDTARTLLDAILKHNIDINTQNKYGNTALHRAARYGHLETLKLLVSRGASLTIKNQTDSTPLFKAIEHQQTQAAIQLIKLGANFQEPNNLGLTPLSLAVSKGLYPLVEHLIAKGVDVNFSPEILGGRKETVLTTAVLNGDEKIVKALLVAGADTNVTVMGYTLPEAAKELGHTHLVETLNQAASSKVQ